MRPTVSQYAEAIEALSQDGESSAGITENLIAFLGRRGELDKATAIVESLEKRVAERNGTLIATVVTAHELTEETRTLLGRKAEKLFPKKKITLLYEIDPMKIGGVSFRTDELLYDATIATELQSLQKALAK